MADDVRSISAMSRVVDDGMSVVNRVAFKTMDAVDATLALIDIGFFNLVDRIHGGIFRTTNFLRGPMDKIYVRKWITNFLIMNLLLIGFVQLSGVIYYTGCAIDWIDSAGFAVSTVVFSCLLGTLFFIYFFMKSIVSQWYDVYYRALLENRAGIMNLEISTASTLFFYIIITSLFVGEYGFEAAYFNGSRALASYQFVASSFMILAFVNMVTIFYNVNLFAVHAETHVLFEIDHSRYNINYLDAAMQKSTF